MGSQIKWDVNEFRGWLLDNVTITQGDGSKGPFVPNDAQNQLHIHCKGMRGKPGFSVIVKARQLGITVYLLLFTAFLLFRNPGMSIIWVTPREDPEGAEVLHKWRQILQGLRLSPNSGWCPATHDNKRETIFSNGSRVTWHHIGGTESVASSVGRAGTFALMVLTELGFPTEADFVYRMLNAVEPALKRVHAPVIVDSTPGDLPGTGEPYRDIAIEVKDGVREGEIIFLAWWTYEGYRLDLEDPVAFAKTLTVEEIVLLKQHRLSLHQIAWRRKERAPRSKESLEMAHKRFARNYPESFDDAFIELSGDSLFDPELILALQRQIRTGATKRPLRGEDVEELLPDSLKVGAGDLMLRPKLSGPPGEGYVRIFEPPDGAESTSRRARCFIGVDCSDGLPGGDWQTATILDRAGQRVAYARCRIDKYRWAAIVQRLVFWYGAYGVIEDQYGELIDRLVAESIGEDEIARQDARPGELDILMVRCLALRLEATTQTNRRLYFDALFGLLIRPKWHHDKETIREMIDLIRHKGGKIAARSGKGCHDDIMLSTGIAEHERVERMAQVNRRSEQHERRAGRGRPGGGRRRRGRAAGRYGYLK